MDVVREGKPVATIVVDSGVATASSPRKRSGQPSDARAAEGLRNAEEYIALREAMNRGDFAAAKRVYDGLLARSKTNQQAGLGHHYTVAYLERFVGKHVYAAAAAAASPSQLVQVLPDGWRLEYDPSDRGLEKGYHRPGFEVDVSGAVAAGRSC